MNNRAPILAGDKDSTSPQPHLEGDGIVATHFPI